MIVQPAILRPRSKGTARAAGAEMLSAIEVSITEALETGFRSM